jgi:hypothetical protein
MIKSCLQNLCSSTLVFFIISSAQLTANELDLRINDDSIHTNFTTANDSTMFGLGYFYKNDRSSTNIINTDLHAKGQTAIANLPMTVGIGFQGNFLKKNDFKGSAVGLGGSLRINIPDVIGLSVETELHYAPEVLSFGDANEFKRFSLQTNYRIIQNADISVGYQYINTGIEDTNSDHTLESGLFIGMKLKF